MSFLSPNNWLGFPPELHASIALFTMSPVDMSEDVIGIVWIAHGCNSDG